MSRTAGPAETPKEPTAPDDPVSMAGRMSLRIHELADCLGVSRRTIERERSAGLSGG
jgi:hypothetical protein